jgi:hypothetical protein
MREFALLSASPRLLFGVVLHYFLRELVVTVSISIVLKIT